MFVTRDVGWVSGGSGDVVDVGEFATACRGPEEESVCFFRRNKGSKLYLSWPVGCFILFLPDGDLCVTGNDLRRLSDEYLCCPERLSVVGGLVWSFANHRHLCAFGDIVETAHRLPVVMLGESSRIYVYDRDGDAVYLLGDDVDGFLKRGLRRFCPVYAELGPMAYANELSETDDVLAFASVHRDETYELPWPRAAYVRLISPRGRRPSSDGHRMSYFARVSGRHLDPEFREVLLAVGETGEIFSYNPWDEVLVRVASDIRGLFAMGLRGARKTYRYRPRVASDERLPRCPHVPRVELPSPLRGEDSTTRCLLRMFKGLSGGRRDGEEERDEGVE
uniref:Tegument protein US22 n=1 Tax=Lemniscomys rat herpesvirus TaxID=3141920 RepID=A0AAU7E1V0_9VIRU